MQVFAKLFEMTDSWFLFQRKWYSKINDYIYIYITILSGIGWFSVCCEQSREDRICVWQYHRVLTVFSGKNVSPTSHTIHTQSNT